MHRIEFAIQKCVIHTMNVYQTKWRRGKTKQKLSIPLFVYFTLDQMRHTSFYFFLSRKHLSFTSFALMRYVYHQQMVIINYHIDDPSKRNKTNNPHLLLVWNFLRFKWDITWLSEKKIVTRFSESIYPFFMLIYWNEKWEVDPRQNEKKVFQLNSDFIRKIIKKISFRMKNHRTNLNPDLEAWQK